MRKGLLIPDPKMCSIPNLHYKVGGHIALLQNYRLNVRDFMGKPLNSFENLTLNYRKKEDL